MSTLHPTNRSDCEFEFDDASDPRPVRPDALAAVTRAITGAPVDRFGADWAEPLPDATRAPCDGGRLVP